MKKYQNIKLSKLIEILQTAKERAEDLDPDVEFWFKNKFIALDSISQFGIVPDITINLTTVKKYEEKKNKTQDES